MGNEIFKTVTKATGLPEDLIRDELGKVLNAKGIARDEVSLDELRAVLAEYLRETILNAKEEFEDGVVVEEEVHPDDLGK